MAEFPHDRLDTEETGDAAQEAAERLKSALQVQTILKANRRRTEDDRDTAHLYLALTILDLRFQLGLSFRELSRISGGTISNSEISELARRGRYLSQRRYREFTECINLWLARSGYAEKQFPEWLTSKDPMII